MQRQAIRPIGDGTTAIAAFRDALNKEDFSDVVFKIKTGTSSSSSSGGGSNATTTTTTAADYQPVHAHRAILAARSPVFKNMFFAGFPESRQREVVVDDVKYEHFMAVLEWAYCGTTQMSAKDVLGVLQAAHYYGLDDLMSECRGLAHSFIDEENVLHLLEHAAALGETNLVVQCLGFVKGNALPVLTSAAWLEVSADCVERVLSLPAIDCEEALLFEQCTRWLEVNTSLRQDLVAVADATMQKKKATGKKMNGKKKKKSKGTKADASSSNNNNNNDDGDGENGGGNEHNENVSNYNQDQPEAEATEDDDMNNNNNSDNTSVDASDNDEEEDDDDDNEAEDELADEKAEAICESARHQRNQQQQQQQQAASSSSSSSLLPSRPLVRRFFRLLRLSHLSVSHLLDSVRPLLAAHPSIRAQYVAALEYLVSPGHIGAVVQVPRAPTVLSSVQVDVAAEFLKGWRVLCTLPQSAGSAFGPVPSQMLAPNFFDAVPSHAAYICVGEMSLGRDDAIGVMAVGCVRIVRPIIGSRSPIIAEDGDICWHASSSTFGFTPKNSADSSSASAGSVVVGAGRRPLQGVRFTISTTAVNMQQAYDGAAAKGFPPGYFKDEAPRHGKRFIYYK